MQVSSAFTNDPYERFLEREKFNKNLIPFDNSSKWAKKWKKFTNRIYEARNNMIQGAIMGFCMGGLFGFFIGCYTAFQTRRFLAIPISTLISGVSFGFILGCGSMIRSDEILISQMGGRCRKQQLEQDDWRQVFQFNNRQVNEYC